MNECIEVEIAALWKELVHDNPGRDVDALLTEAHQQIAELLAFGAEWDQAATAQRIDAALGAASAALFAPANAA